MRRLILLTSVIVMLTGGLAVAGRGGRGGHGHRGGHVSHRGGGAVVVRDHRAVRGHPGRGHHKHRAVYVSNGRYVFPGGVSRTYVRPVIRQRYYNVRVRPPIIVEHYDPVPGYVWVGGNWRWGGSEWVWSPGHWSVGASVGVSAGVSVY